ncbi:MAG: superoxide dismutase family protein [Tagaea sp.]|nr:superoxide dismutase family protein [Tagaea sp.]
MRTTLAAALLAATALAGAAFAQMPQMPQIQIPATPQVPVVPPGTIPGTAAPAATQAPTPVARAGGQFIDREGRTIGSVTMVEAPRGILINITINQGGLTAGRKGIHIHSVGTCDDRTQGFVASGGHLGAPGLPHGLLNPTGDYGDLPNLIVRADGGVEVEMFTTLASLTGASGRGTILDNDGGALVVHQNPDDHFSQPIGGAGPRIACAVVRRQ